MKRRVFFSLAGLFPGLRRFGFPFASAAARGGPFSEVFRGDKPDQVVKLAGPGRRAGSAAFSPDGSSLIVGHDDGSVHRYNASTGRETGNFQARAQKDPIHAIAFAPDGRFFAIAATVSEPDQPEIFHKPLPPGAGDCAVSIFDDRGREVRRLPRMMGKILCVAYSRDGKRVAAIDQTYVARAWNLDDGRLSFVSEAHRANGQQLDYSASRVGFSSNLEHGVVLNDCPDGDYGGAKWGQVTRLIVPGGREPLMIRCAGDPTWCVAISPDGSRVVTGSADHWLRVWDFATARRLNTSFISIPLGVKPEDRGPEFVAFSPDGRRIVTGSQRYAWVYEDDRKETGVALRTFEGPGGFIRAVAFLPGRIRFASGGFSILDGQFIERPNGRDARFEPVTIWDVKVPEKN